MVPLIYIQLGRDLSPPPLLSPGVRGYVRGGVDGPQAVPPKRGALRHQRKPVGGLRRRRHGGNQGNLAIGYGTVLGTTLYLDILLCWARHCALIHTVLGTTLCLDSYCVGHNTVPRYITVLGTTLFLDTYCVGHDTVP